MNEFGLYKIIIKFHKYSYNTGGISVCKCINMISDQSETLYYLHGTITNSIINTYPYVSILRD